MCRYSYNNANLLTSTTAESQSTNYEYDAAERLKKIIYPSSEVTNYAYTPRGLLDVIKDGSNATIASYTYDDDGRLTKEICANGLECIYDYNDANWITKITLRETATPANIRQSFEYGYDNVGNRTYVKYVGASGDVYQYDAKSQLTGVKYGVSNPASGYASATGGNRTVTYDYDAVGNRTQITDTAASTISYSANSVNQYTQIGSNTCFVYDNNGNLTGDGTWVYGYDREGHLITASKSGANITYKYDANGKRIEKILIVR